MPTISVIIPNYNRANLIGETLENLLRQTRAPDEIIVIDDGSTDNSAEVIAAFAPRVRLIQQANAGPAAARNRGLAEASGDYIQFFDSDDLCSLNKLEAQAAALYATGADLAYGPWLQARLEGGVARYPDLPLQQRALPASLSPLAWFLRDWVIVFQCCMVRRTLLERVGAYRTDLMLGEDAELLFRMFLAGAKAVHVPEALVLYRLHYGAQLSRGGINDARRAGEWFKFTQAISQTIAAQPQAFTRADRAHWRWTAHEAALDHHRLADPATPHGLSALTRALVPLRKHLKRWRAGAARRLTGTRLSRAYGVGPLTAMQQDLIRAIGYEPVFDPAAHG
jgi:glycosyltransferase involved in cell wall biosynthesis